MRKPTDDFFSFSYRSVKSWSACLQTIRERGREREMKVFQWGYMFPICTHASFWTDEEEGSHFSCESRVLPDVASVVCRLFFLVAVL